MRVNAPLIAIDPGATSGVAIGQYLGSRMFIVSEVYELIWSQRFEIKKVIRTLAPRIPYIIVEEYRIFPDKAIEQAWSKVPSAQMIGIIEAVADDCHLLHNVFYQKPSQISNTRVLDRDEPLTRSARDHKRDAYKHLRYFVLMNNGRQI